MNGQTLLTKMRMLAAALFLAGSSSLFAQDVAVKSNLVSDAFLNPNLGVEIGVAPKWTLDVSGQFNLWTLSNDRRWKHWLAQPEIRYWFCQKYFGHFVGAHLLGGQYNVGGLKGLHDFLGLQLSRLDKVRFQGWFAGAGVAYGYTWILNRHWNFEAEIGVGYVYRRYDVFPCAHCGTKLESGKSRNYVGPTKAALNIIYVF